VRDQTSSAHPYGALVVPALARAAGIFHTTPKLIVLPEDGKLGEFREDFSGVVGMMEEFVIHGPGNTPGFAGFEHIVSSYELTDILENSFDDYVDPQEFLKARLLDILISNTPGCPSPWTATRRSPNLTVFYRRWRRTAALFPNSKASIKRSRIFGASLIPGAIWTASS